MAKKIELALSVRQPYAELIMCGDKKWEYRSKRCNLRGRIYIYAGKKPPKDEKDAARVKAHPGKFPTGVIVGSVEIVGCKEHGDIFKWKLENPKRCRHRKTSKQPQAVFFKPF
jgi:hypothetical protein